ncbi:hypothetical protein RN001_000573 [Aquatica leii]|uniref:Coiled-coil domain-containing protein 13 n=1 Tax=Aquatica leii TaxID=1421715 RepID=A0AAN7Q779_9COLE|nr:hypothetical protein RN001_000573 [Aquatica leii]
MDKNRINSLGVSDNLNLSNITVPDIPKNIIFPDDLNKYLRDRVQYLTHENGMLYKNMSELEVRLKESVSKVNTLSDELEKTQSGPQNSPNSSENFACSKIVELSKQLRERNSEIESYKTKCAKLQKHLNEIEKDRPNKEAEEKQASPQKPKNELEEQIKQLTEKLNTANNKLCEIRNANSQLKSNAKLANKLLQQEIGESFENIQTTINANGTWRGRSQVICDLQQKNADLREKLKALEEKSKDTVSRNQTDPAPVTKWDKRLASLTQENEDLRSNAQDVKKKLDASRARNKVIESENTVLRAKLSTYSEQNERDHETIASLTVKVSHSQEIQNEAIRQKQSIIQELEETNKKLQLEIAKQSCKINNITAQVEDQKREIDNYRTKIKHQTQPLDVKANRINLQHFEAERLKLLELTKVTNNKLDLERNAHSETHLRYLAERQKAAKLEARVARLQLEKSSDRTSAYSLKSNSPVNNVNNDKLQLAEETIKALQTRLDIERQEHKNNINEFTKILSNYDLPDVNKK